MIKTLAPKPDSPGALRALILKVLYFCSTAGNQKAMWND